MYGLMLLMLRARKRQNEVKVEEDFGEPSTHRSREAIGFEHPLGFFNRRCHWVPVKETIVLAIEPFFLQLLPKADHATQSSVENSRLLGRAGGRIHLEEIAEDDIGFAQVNLK